MGGAMMESLALLGLLIFFGIAIAEMVKPSSKQDFWPHDVLHRDDGHGWEDKR